jgi:SAM-dependent methyltransferase
MSRSELARILAEFERRERELPAHRYAWSTPASLMMHQQAVRGCIRLLHEAGLYPLNGTASKLPWPDESFDLVSQFTVFTSVLNSELKQMIAQEMQRVLRPGGCVLWFDFRFDNPRNRNVRGIRSAEIHSLFKGCHVRLLPVLLAPPLARMVAGWCWPLAELLHTLRPLRTHHAGLIWKKPV